MLLVILIQFPSGSINKTYRVKASKYVSGTRFWTLNTVFWKPLMTSDIPSRNDSSSGAKRSWEEGSRTNSVMNIGRGTASSVFYKTDKNMELEQFFYKSIDPDLRNMLQCTYILIFQICEIFNLTDRKNIMSLMNIMSYKGHYIMSLIWHYIHACLNCQFEPTCSYDRTPLSTLSETSLGYPFCHSQVLTTLFLNCIVCFYDCK